jgi:hypothetical protein
MRKRQGGIHNRDGEEDGHGEGDRNKEKNGEAERRTQAPLNLVAQYLSVSYGIF